MASPNEKLADSLAILKQAADLNRRVFKSGDFGRVHRDRLVEAGFLKNVVKGWYIVANPSERAGESTAWYASFFEFVSAYCTARFGNDWYLSPEASLQQHAGNGSIPRQMIIHAKNGTNNTLAFEYETSIFDYCAKGFVDGADVTIKNGLRLLSVPAALIRVAPNFFAANPIDARVALSGLPDVSELLARMLDDGNPVVAGRLAGAFRAVGRKTEADSILKAMRAAGYVAVENNPFHGATEIGVTNARPESACATRIRLMWAAMRTVVINTFPEQPGLPDDPERYLADVDDKHLEDAYHSLSIEGYRVSEEMIARVAAGNWNPDENENDKNDRNALAAKGYHDAFLGVRASVAKIIRGEPPGAIAQNDHHEWYRRLFSSSVQSGILKPRHLAGYRTWPVYIRQARHVPPSHEAMRETMPTFFDLISNEPDASVRAVLGHFIFVYLHPYGDGNGRIGRFLMNAMLASGGYPWAIVRLEDRDRYMASLEQASVNGNIEPFAEFIGSLAKDQMKQNLRLR